MNGIRTHNVRLGFATNSSSTHSLVFLPDGTKVRDDYEPGSFGWDNFTVVSEKGKREYLGILLWKYLRESMPEKVADMVCRKWVKHVPGEDDHVDHQSLYPLPSDFLKPSFPDEQFFVELRDFVLRPGLTILGGNDNEKDSHPLSDRGCFRIPGNYGTESVCRKDPQGYWTIFSRKDGTKVRFSFPPKDDAPVACRPTKAYAPELVDVKITDACSKNCPWCYQDSSPDGVHAESTWLWRLTDALSELKVFEVALGGGEPTSHPNFVGTVMDFRTAGVVPNFSTKSLDWLRDNRKWPSVIENCGKFAFSVETIEDAKEFMALVQSNGIDKDKIGFQVIIGLIEPWDFAQILAYATGESVPMTLLGYKPVGRGKGIVPLRYENRNWWLEQIAKRKGYSPIGIDTALAKEFEKELGQANVPSLLYEKEEGKFSCYVDAVRMRIGPSSFCGDDQMLDLDLKGNVVDGITTAFAKF